MTVQKIMESLINEYQNTLANTPHMLNTEKETTIVNNFKRNIGYNGGEEYDKKTGFLVTYDVVTVIRDHPIRQIIDTEEEFNAYMVTLFGMAREVFNAWCKIAFSLWDGDLVVPPNYTWVLPECNFPCITVFANMTDSSGRTYTLTLTEQSNLSDAVVRVGYCNWLYDEMCAISAGVDMNSYGKTSYGLKANPPSKKTYATKAKEKINLPRAIKPTIKVIETITDMKDLNGDTSFKINIQKISLKEKNGDSTLNFYGYEKNIHNELVPSDDCVYVYSSRVEYEELLRYIKTIDPTFGNTTFNLILSDAISITAKKIVTDDQKVYYVDAAIV